MLIISLERKKRFSREGGPTDSKIVPHRHSFPQGGRQPFTVRQNPLSLPFTAFRRGSAAVGLLQGANGEDDVKKGTQLQARETLPSAALPLPSCQQTDAFACAPAAILPRD